MSLRELRLALLGLGAVVTSAVVVGVLVPKAKALGVARQTIAELEASAEDGSALQDRLLEEDARIKDLRHRLHGDMANLPAKQVEAYIIGRLQTASWGNNVELVGVEPATGERVQSFQEMLFNVRLNGRYDDLYRWLWDVRNDLGYIVIKEYRLVREDDDDAEPLLGADLSLASYRSIE
ncbi:MAG: type 4a pilus biogenesis protein PilO [Woeseiaceae bacterium]|nr:type 4a pilus biogenesis protein PilO [Woeseiaceae bacterium]